MVQLVLIYCLLADNKSCIEKRPVTELPLSPMECLIQAQPMAAAFLEEHPAYQLNSFRCEVNKPDEKSA